uniref:Serine/threonine protein kinase n=1 Tax=Desulfobacca acetoxidans TaxID=60893 RepID=A0A7C5AK38_9BACT
MTKDQCIWITGSKTSLPILEKILLGGGYRVVVKEAAEVLAPGPSAGKPDLLLVAEEPSRLPRFLTSIKAQSAFREVPVIAALTRFSDAAATQSLGLGAEEFLLPPFQPQEVLARVMVVLRLNEQRRLLMASQAEFTRLFQENPQPLFYCDREGRGARLNPALLRLLGYDLKKGQKPPEELDQLFYEEEDRKRFHQVLKEPSLSGSVKVRLKNRSGQAVTVLLRDLAQSEAFSGQVGFHIQPVGSLSPLKKALQTLVDNFLPAARDYLGLLQMTPLLGGRYEKLKKLGQGSFGEVWLVRDTEVVGELRQYVAKIPLSPAANPKFRKEAEISRRLSPHPGVVKLVEVLEEEGKVILIQEYVAGRTLADMLSEELPPAFLEHLILQLIDVVAHAHQHRIMHRDIKPGNIIVQDDGTLKLLDFGAAKILREKDISATMVGSRPFMAPEQIMGKSEIRSDIWAIGVLMYLLYTGELPFYSEVEKLLIDQILEQEPIPPRKLNPGIPEALEAIILRCLAKEVDRRYKSALALKADLLRNFPHYGEQAA